MITKERGGIFYTKAKILDEELYIIKIYYIFMSRFAIVNSIIVFWTQNVIHTNILLCIFKYTLSLCANGIFCMRCFNEMNTLFTFYATLSEFSYNIV